ncbi:hypothetical protein BFR04_07215 [Gaetbulibacter sp. 4G1]|nr:glycosyltransferase family A protein [Gaetbulibacter sp. 4G1]PIA78014.1 hypothetical protein BFR04_07215 [Gaetbulibacter sp. 4G1]
MKSNVTVVIPCFNDGDYIVEALNSVLKQTLKAEKIVIVDDGSNAHTKGILKTLKHDNLEVIYQENQGVCVARNTGISLATTDYILNLDADDFFKETFIEKAVKILDSNLKTGIVGCYYNCFTEQKVDNNIIKPLGGSVNNFLVKNNGLNCSMFRKICWENVFGYDVSFVNGYEDWDFWISILSKNWEMAIIKEPLFNYRIKKKSRDQDANKKYDFDLKKQLFTKHKEVYLKYYDSSFLELIRINGLLKNKINRLEKSINYRTGALVLSPFRFLKSIFK